MRMPDLEVARDSVFDSPLGVDWRHIAGRGRAVARAQPIIGRRGSGGPWPRWAAGARNGQARCLSRAGAKFERREWWRHGHIRLPSSETNVAELLVMEMQPKIRTIEHIEFFLPTS